MPYISFNPRTRVGCDSNCAWAAWLAEFQSTHPCGVRLIAKHQMEGLKVSIHAPVWGATFMGIKRPYHELFQSTHPCGVRRAGTCYD